jgi:hypothetical protein
MRLLSSDGRRWSALVGTVVLVWAATFRPDDLAWTPDDLV